MKQTEDTGHISGLQFRDNGFRIIPPHDKLKAFWTKAGINVKHFKFMKKKNGIPFHVVLKKILRIMRITAVFVFILSMHVYAESFGQVETINLKMNSNIREVFEQLEKVSGYRFVLKYDQSFLDKQVNVNYSNEKIEKILDNLLKDTGFTYKVIDMYIAIVSAGESYNTTQQQKSVSGKVTDSMGVPLPGVSVVVEGTTNGTITDTNGNYSLSKVGEDAILQFSFVGMKTQEVAIDGKTTINVTLEEAAIGIEEVVAVGYGVQKKRDIIGSISVMKSVVLEAPSGSSNFNSLLQGQAAGVSVQSSSGRLGANVDIKVRGLSSISAGTSPLWIIDGVPIITDINVDNNGSAAQSPMALINQSDIESIQVLKDAAATSIYGSRGSNGVIMITTKSGATGKASLNVDYSTGISDLPSQRPQFINTTQWFEMMDESKKAYGLGEFTMSDIYSKQPYATEFLTRAQAEKINTNWFKETMRKGSFQNVNFSTTGGDKAVRYFVSGNYRNDKSVMNNEDLERYGLRANIDLKPTNSLDFGTKINLSLSNGDRGKNNYGGGNSDGNKTGTGGGFSYINYVAMPFEPVHSLANPLLYYNPYAGNPVATSDPANMVENLKMYRVLASTYAEYALPVIKGLSARTELSVDFIQSNRNFWVSDAIRFLGSLAQDNSSTARTINYNVFLKYDKSFGDHNLNMVGGTESQRSMTWYRNMEGQNLIGKYQQLGTPSLLTTMSSGLAGENYLKSYFGRANYKFKDKYLAGISVRRDGSSVFTPEYRWGNFIALSAGWILSDEAFMGEFGKKHFIKVRGSFGQTGNASIPGKLDVTGYQTNLGYGDGIILGNNGTLVTSIGVTNLRWESTNNSDLGIDFGFFDHRIDGSLAYYNKYVKDLLLASALPRSAGVASIWGNIGDLVNSGIELSVTTTNLTSAKFKWQTTLNIAYNHNEVKKLTPQVDAKGTGMSGAPYISKVGYGVREYYIADFAGIDPQTGLGQIYALDKDTYAKTGETKRLKDAQGKDVLLLATSANSNTNYFHLKGKSAMPKFYGGITNKFTCKAFDLSVLVTFSGGNYILDTFLRNIASQNSSSQQLTDVYENHWKKPGDNAKYQRMTWNGNVKLENGTIVGMGDPRTWSNQFLYKGDFVKLKSVNLGYTLPKSSGKRFFQSLRLFASFENLYTLTKYPGWDPEGQGVVGQWDLPQLFSASAGVNVKF